MCKVEVELPVERHPEGGGNKGQQVVGARGGSLVRQEGDPESHLMNNECKLNHSMLTCWLLSNVHKQPPKQ